MEIIEEIHRSHAPRFGKKNRRGKGRKGEKGKGRTAWSFNETKIGE